MRIRHTISEMKKSRIGIHPKLKQKSNPFPLSPAFSDTCERAVFFGAIHPDLTNAVETEPWLHLARPAGL
jgi:hypothetical protein